MIGEADLAALIALAEGWTWAALAVFARIGAAMALMPAVGEAVVPMRVRLALALAFTIVVAPVMADALPPPPDSALGLAGFLGAEAVAGLSFGIGLRLTVMALQIAGTMAAQATSLAQFFGGANVDPQPAMAQLLLLAGLALALAVGLHVRLAEGLIASYDVLPPGRLPAGADLAEWGVGRVAQAFSLAFMLAVPFLIAATVYNLALGAINRAMPQLMVAFVGAPALTAGGLVLLLLVTPVALALWLGVFDAALSDPFGPLP